MATDLAGRGLDISNVDRVINYHLPKQKENYIHRVGRTARAGRQGVVVNLVTERDERLIAQIEGRKPPTTRNADKYRGDSKEVEKVPAQKAKHRTPFVAKGKMHTSASSYFSLRK